MLSFNSVHECFKYNGTHYNLRTLKSLALHLIENEETYKKNIGEFLLQWQDTSNTIDLKTSGSTGTPKTIAINKQAMVNSAIATGYYFNLKPSEKALLCLPAHYVAGKMMLVRALVLGLEIDSIAPKSNLEVDKNKQYQFCAMVPMQLEQNLNKLTTIKTLIVGGAKVSLLLISKLKQIKTTVYETYGMTETVSHVAVKQLNNFESDKECHLEQSEESKEYHFKTLPNVSISQDKRQCLIIEAPNISEEKIITNDIVEMHSKNEFEWLGRIDNIINSGGVKIFPEQIENSLYGKINSRFFIASEEDKSLGESVILVIEGDHVKLEASVFNSLEPFAKPKKIYFLPKFIETPSGKIRRKKNVQLLK